MLTSSQIAELNGTFQRQHLERMQAASMMGSPGFGNFSEGVVGGALNRSAAVAAPLATLGTVAMGWDPFSVALKAGMGAHRMGAGVLGAGAAGMVGAGVAAVPAMAAQYTFGQFMQGAQQQQQFNASMRQGYSFFNPAGGQGFSRNDLGAIGSTLTQMTTQQGPGGELVGFAELGRLASNMGRMGMAQGVRDAKEFTEKFRTMVQSLKDIATEMGTSLEEAQKMMVAMRGSGVFGNKGAAAAASMIKGAAQAGGLAASEVTGMMHIGSQYSRSIGGLGRAGARGGLETIANIGVAQQLGVLSEEDIYNATGLTGAEGRRALATQQLGSAAQFLRGGLGRRFLASIAGRDGALDASSVEEYMGGGVGTGRTMEMAHRNLSKVGRANFIRNEGRLRGEALGQFGGLAPAMVMKGWLDQRGFDLDEDSDRAMIFAQRRLGLGRDEADTMIKQVKALPQILRERRLAGEEGDFAERMSRQQSHQGLSGIKHKFEKFRADLDSGLQQVGSDFYQESSEYVERFVNKLTGAYLKEFHRDLGRSFEQGMRGGAAGRAELSRAFGAQGSGAFGLRGIGSVTGGADVANFRLMDGDRFKEAGYNLGGMRNGRELQGGLDAVNAVSMAFQTGGQGLAGREGIASLGEGAAEDIRRSLSLGGVSGKGLDRLSSFSGLLGRLAKDRGGAFNSLAARYHSAGSEERAQIMATLTEAAGVEGEASMFAVPELQGIMGATQYATAGEKNAAMGRAVMGTEGTGRFMGFMRGLFGMKRGPSEREVTSTGAYFESEEGRSLVSGALGTDAEGRAASRKQIQKELTRLQQKGDLTDAELGQRNALRGMSFYSEIGELEGTPEFDRRVSQLARESKLGVNEVLSMAGGAKMAYENQMERNRAEVAERYGMRARDKQASMQRGGTLTRNPSTGQLELRSDLVGSASNIGAWNGDTSTAQRFLQSIQEQQGALAGMGRAGQTAAERNRLWGIASGAGERQDQEMAAMSAKDKRALAGVLRGEAGLGDTRSELLAQAGIQEKLDRSGKGGRLGALSRMLGTGLSAEDLKGILSGRGAEGLTGVLGESLGLQAGGSAMKALQEAVTATQSGQTGKAASALRSLTGSEEYVEAQKKKALASAEAENPLAAKTNTHLDNLNKTLSTLKDTAVSQLSVLREMNTSSSNAELKEE